MDSISSIILAVSLFIIMLGMGLSLTPEDFYRVVKYPKAIIIGLFNQLIILPILGFSLVYLFNAPTEIAIGIIILAACPGGPTSNLISHLAKADTALSVSLTAISSLITIITIPFIVNLGLNTFYKGPADINLDVISTLAQIFIIVIIPVGIGMLLKAKKETFADKMAKPVRIGSGIVLLLIIIGIIIKENENFLSYFQQAGIIAVSLNILSMGIGLLSARIFSITLERARSISIESGIQNGTMAISIATVLLMNPAFAIAPAVYSLIMFFSGGIVIYFGNKAIS
jgi:BASS family bile acid:Na+ symporter